ncbi:MAG: VCBS repeat-containing protein [Myxococcales bacterium]|nr:VCBS repeat-containing protein [Myxococcales bacterium]
MDSDLGIAGDVDAGTEEIVEIPRFQCGLGEGVSPSEPLFEALPPYISASGVGIVSDMTGDNVPEVLGSDTLYANGTTVPSVGPSLSFFSTLNAYGDFDGDGLWDMIGSVEHGKIGFWRQSYLGHFEKPELVLKVETTEELGFTAANLEGDARPEVVVSDGRRIRSYRLNTEKVTLAQLGEGFVDGKTNIKPDAFDLNQDGFDEVLYGGVQSFNENGTVSEWPGYPTMPKQSNVAFHAPFDVDLDGFDEIVGFTSSDDVLIIRRGPIPEFEVTMSWFPGKEVWPLGDLTGDDLDEMVVISGSYVGLHSRTGLSDFVELAAAARGQSGGKPIVVDIDLDGDLDVYTSGPVLFENHGPLGFEGHDVAWVVMEQALYEGVSQLSTDPAEVDDATCTCLPPKTRGAAADFDGDGMVDLVRASALEVVVARGLGDGRFANRKTAKMNRHNPDLRRWVGLELATPDLNGDGRPDIVVWSRNTEWHCANNTQWAAFTVKDDFTLEALSLPIDKPHGVDFADIDGNGLTDIVSFHPWDIDSAYSKSGIGTCQPKEQFDSEELEKMVPFCCATRNSAAEVRITLQTAPGVFESRVHERLRAEAHGHGCTFDEDFSVVDGTLVDVTGDGKLDLVASHTRVRKDAVDVVFFAEIGMPCYTCEWVWQAPSWRIDGAFLVVHPGDGAGHFGPGRTIGGTAHDAVRSLGHADLDGDGDDDLLVTTDLWRGVLVNPSVSLASPSLDGPVCNPNDLEDLDSSPFRRNRLNWWATDSMRPANLNGDRCADFAPALYFQAYNVGSIQSILGDGVGPGTWHYLAAPGTSETSYDDIITGDFNGDGLDDLFVPNSVWEGPSSRVLLNRTRLPVLRGEPTP